ncbi:MAG: peptidoglycan-binding protein [Deltaproteobacteria bacterium]|nr:peptidoglycan-binding protein [Deltaproteobacteria bacterium]
MGRRKTMAFRLNRAHLERLCLINSFPVRDRGMVFFGFRGCLPLDEDDQEFKAEHRVVLAGIDYLHPRCMLGQWLPREGRIALFPGSTVPHLRYVKASKEKDGLGANQMMTGYYKDYRKGIHLNGSPTAHEAFRQTEGHPVRRTADDFDFDNDDRVEFANPYDNIHAGWTMGVNHDSYASAGCQVIVGYPRCESRGNMPDEGPWKRFKANAYGLDQQGFPYLLLNGRDAQKTALGGTRKVPARLRFGSKGDLVSALQEALQEKGYYEGNLDGDFGRRTIRAVLEFQTRAFGPGGDDGIVGPITASALGL